MLNFPRDLFEYRYCLTLEPWVQPNTIDALQPDKVVRLEERPVLHVVVGTVA
jgi:hypothetical protein